MVLLSLDATRREPGDEVALGHDEQHHHREDRDDAHRHDCVPVGAVVPMNETIPTVTGRLRSVVSSVFANRKSPQAKMTE